MFCFSLFPPLLCVGNLVTSCNDQGKNDVEDLQKKAQMEAREAEEEARRAAEKACKEAGCDKFKVSGGRRSPSALGVVGLGGGVGGGFFSHVGMWLSVMLPLGWMLSNHLCGL